MYGFIPVRLLHFGEISEDYAKSTCVCANLAGKNKSVLAYLASSADFLSVRIRFLGKFPIDLGGRKICLKIILSRKNSPKKSNVFFQPQPGVTKGSLIESVRKSL